MTRYAALLRGVNVAGHGKLAMSDLRELFERLGFVDVATYIQSGNVTFSSQRPPRPHEIHDALLSAFELDTDVATRSHDELAALVGANPFRDSTPTSLHVGFTMGDDDPRGDLDLARFAPEVATFYERDVFVHLPSGMGVAKLPAFLSRSLGVPVTFRNWNTVTRLAAMTAD